MRKAEFVVVMRRIWMSHMLFEGQPAEKHDAERELFVCFARDILDGLPDGFSVEELWGLLQERREKLMKARASDLTWVVVFDGILGKIVDAVGVIAKMPEDKRPAVIETEIQDGICCICGEALSENDKHDPEPVASGEAMKLGAACCASCNDLYVVPARNLLWIPRERKIKEPEEEVEKEETNPYRLDIPLSEKDAKAESKNKNTNIHIEHAKVEEVDGSEAPDIIAEARREARAVKNEDGKEPDGEVEEAEKKPGKIATLFHKILYRQEDAE